MKKGALFTIFLTIFLDFFNLGLIYPLFSALVFEKGGALISADASDFYKNVCFGLFIAAYPFGQFLGSPFLGQMSDLQGRRKVLVLSLIGTVATLFLCSLGVFSSSPLLLLLGRFSGGLMAGNITIAYASLSDISTEQNKVRNFALIPLSSGMGFASGPYFAGILANPENHQFAGPALPFLTAAFLSMINLIVAWWYFPKAEVKKTTSAVPNVLAGMIILYKAFKNSAVNKYLWILFFMLSANWLFVQYAGPLAIDKFQINITEVGYLYANIGASVAFGHIFLTRRLGEYISSEKALAWSLIALAGLLILLVLSPNLIVLHIVTFFIMLACAVGYTNSMALTSNCAKKDQQGEIMGVAVSIQNCAEFLPAALVSLLAFISSSIPLLTAAICAFSSFALLTRLVKKVLVAQR